MHLLERFPDADLALFIVFTDVLAGDGREGAREAALIFEDGRATVLHDPDRSAGRALAATAGITDMDAIVANMGGDRAKLAPFFKAGFLAGPPALFDTVFFFDEGAAWSDQAAPPVPVDWLTQLVPTVYAGIDPTRFFWEHDFYAELERRAARWLTE